MLTGAAAFVMCGFDGTGADAPTTTLIVSPQTGLADNLSVGTFTRIRCSAVIF